MVSSIVFVNNVNQTDYVVVAAKRVLYDTDGNQSDGFMIDLADGAGGVSSQFIPMETLTYNPATNNAIAMATPEAIESLRLQINIMENRGVLCLPQKNLMLEVM